jgi:molybdopterin converting factor small subunit
LKIRVRCFTGMRQYAPEGEGDFKTDLAEGTRVGQLLDKMGVPVDTRPFIAVNGFRVERDKPLNDNDTVVLFTSMEGG